MAEKSFTVNPGGAGARKIDADWYRVEGDFFVFYEGAGNLENVVYTYAARAVTAIKTEQKQK